MAFSDDIADDYLIFDDVKDATFTPVAAAGSPIPGVKVLMHPVSRQSVALAAQAAIELQADDIEMEVFTATLAGQEPHRSDLLTIGSITYWIQMATKATLGTRWHCVCRKNPA